MHTHRYINPYTNIYKQQYCSMHIANKGPLTKVPASLLLYDI